MHEFHGHSQKDRLYRIWVAMRQRCSKKYSSSYGAYGGRGIKVCPEWEASFIKFKAWAESTGYDQNLSIDRKDTNGDYSPQNCRWSTAQEQSENKINQCRVNVNGETKTVAAWSKLTGIHLTTLYRRYRKGITGQEFLKKTIPKPAPISLESLRAES